VDREGAHEFREDGLEKDRILLGSKSRQLLCWLVLDETELNEENDDHRLFAVLIHPLLLDKHFH